MLLLTLFYVLITSIKSEITKSSTTELFSHEGFECDPESYAYKTSFTFLNGLGHGFVHAETNRIYFEYYFPSTYWVGFGTADQSIQRQKDYCTTCYFNNYYSSESTKSNQSNLYPKCIEQCLDDTIFVASVNSDEQNRNNWNFIEFQITAQKSKKLDKKILALWGSESYPYRQNAHFLIDLYTVGHGEEAKDYIHARFWRDYVFGEYGANKWIPMTNSPDREALCFISIASFDGGAYPYNHDALQGALPGFYIDAEHAANIHCFKLNDIKLDCGQDWSFLDIQHNDIQDDDYDDEEDSYYGYDGEGYDDNATDHDYDETYDRNRIVTTQKDADITNEKTFEEYLAEYFAESDTDTDDTNYYIDTDEEIQYDFSYQPIYYENNNQRDDFITTTYREFSDSPMEGEHNWMLYVVLKGVLTVIVGIFVVICCVQMCIKYLCAHKHGSHLLVQLQTMECDQFGDEGVVDKDTSTLITI